MKLKINKACDLSSISVFPPHSRRTTMISSGNESSALMRSQSSQLRSQSQHSLSQGMTFSQLSQSSLDDAILNDQKFGSQERENSMKRISNLPPMSYGRDDSQMPLSRSSNNIARRWNSSSASDHRCQVSEELEHKIGLMETSLSRLAMVMDSVQSDVMQVNKSVKEVSLEVESMRQKMLAHDCPLQLIIKGHEDIKAKFDSILNSIANELRKELEKYKLVEAASCFPALTDQIESCLKKLQNELCQSLSKEVSKLYNTDTSSGNHPLKIIQAPKRKSYCEMQSSKWPLLIIDDSFASQKAQKNTLALKSETENQKLQKLKPLPSVESKHILEPKGEELPLVEQEHGLPILLESDEEIERLSVLLKSKEKGIRNYLTDDGEETRRILRKARRRKKKLRNAVILI